MSIDYNLIDKECIEMVKFFNECGLKTKYCCQGHFENKTSDNYYIMFDDSVKDVNIFNFINLFENTFTHSPFLGCFVKWMRKISGEIKCNWIYQLTYKNALLNWKAAKHDLQIFKQVILN